MERVDPSVDNMLKITGEGRKAALDMRLIDPYAGSTAEVGAGTNVQRRLVAIHHPDAPWRPGDIKQREGRILGQGDVNKEVQIFGYVTEGSFDAYMWQTLETEALHPAGDTGRTLAPGGRS
jgi:hypothetical protein